MLCCVVPTSIVFELTHSSFKQTTQHTVYKQRRARERVTIDKTSPRTQGTATTTTRTRTQRQDITHQAVSRDTRSLSVSVTPDQSHYPINQFARVYLLLIVFSSSSPSSSRTIQCASVTNLFACHIIFFVSSLRPSSHCTPQTI